MSKWEAVSPLRFNELARTSRADADIRINFVRYDHGDGSSFDGRGKKLGGENFRQSLNMKHRMIKPLNAIYLQISLVRVFLSSFFSLVFPLSWSLLFSFSFFIFFFLFCSVNNKLLRYIKRCQLLISTLRPFCSFSQK